MEELFFPDAAQRADILEPGKVSRKVKARGGRMMLVEVSFAAGARGAEHEHPHERDGDADPRDEDREDEGLGVVALLLRPPPGLGRVRDEQLDRLDEGVQEPELGAVLPREAGERRAALENLAGRRVLQSPAAYFDLRRVELE